MVLHGQLCLLQPKKQVPICYFFFTLLSAVVSPATYYRHANHIAQKQYQTIISTISAATFPSLHWLDNFSKWYKASAVYSNKDLLQQDYWTAHGVKILPYHVDLRWYQTPDGSATIPAMPFLDQLLSDQYHTSILTMLRSIPFLQYDDSAVVRRDVRRIPLKLDLATADAQEAKHLKASYDGLAHFYPVDIYPENIASTDGLLTSFRRLQLLEGFGLQDHKRFGSYSLLHVDVSIYWQLLRFLYCYSVMICLCFGFWHAYSYARGVNSETLS